LLPPTGVSHCSSAFFDHAAAKTGQNSIPNLVVVKFTQLQVYTARVPGAADAEVDLDLARLELVGEWTLSGVVESLSVLKSQQRTVQRDSILLSFRDAKASLIEFDEATNSIKTTSLHCWEDSALTWGRTSFPFPPIAATDPQGRCAAVAMYAHQLALMPAEGSDVLDFLVQEGTGIAEGVTSSSALQTSYVLNLRKLLKIHTVKDICFLHRYNAPVLLILHEAAPSWPGRHKDVRDTCELIAISLDLSARRHTRVWSATALPCDCFAVSPAPAGGALVLSTNYLMYYGQASSYAVAVNKHAFSAAIIPMERTDRNDTNAEPLSVSAAKAARANSRTVAPEVLPAIASRCDPATAAFNLELDGAVVTWLDKGTALLGLKTGRLVTASLKFSAGVVRDILIHGVGSGSVCSCGTRISDDLLFLGSWSGDSLLVRYLPVLEDEAAERDMMAPSARDSKFGSGADDVRMPKRQKLEAVSEIEGAAEEDVEGEGKEEAVVKVEDENDDADDLYGDASVGDASPKTPGGTSKSPFASATQPKRYNLKVLDSLMCLGPIRDLCVMEASLAPECTSEERARAGLQCVVASGNGKGGALTVLRRSMLPDLATEVPIPGASGVWTLHCAAVGVEDPSCHAYMLLGVEQETKVFACGEELEEVTDEGCQFVTTGITVAAASVFDGRAIVQVHRTGVRIVESASVRLQDFRVCDLVSSEENASATTLEVLSAEINGTWILLHLSTGQAALLHADKETKTFSRFDAAADSLQAQPLKTPGAAITACALYIDSGGWMCNVVFANGEDQTSPDTGSAFCVIVRASGMMEIFALPLWDQVFFNSSLTQGYRVMVPESSLGGGTDVEAHVVEALDADDQVTEVRIPPMSTLLANII